MMRTSSISPSAAARTASSPRRAPVGTTMRAPWRAASAMRSGRLRSAPTLSGSRVRPAFRTGSAISANTRAGAHSTTASAASTSAAGLTSGTGAVRSDIRARALSWSPVATAARLNPAMPPSRRRAISPPMAPRPAMPIRSVTVGALTVTPNAVRESAPPGHVPPPRRGRAPVRSRRRRRSRDRAARGPRARARNPSTDAACREGPAGTWR